MWRTIVLGKLFISIVASFIVAVICFQIAGHDQQDAAGASRWYMLSGFFTLLGVSFVGVIYLLFKRVKPHRKSGR